MPPAFERGETTAEASDAGFDLFDPFDPTFEASKVIRTQVEYIEMSHKDLTRLLMEDESKTADATALRMKVQKMVENDQAKVIDTQIVLGQSGQRFVSQSREEFIYPTEWEPPIHKKKQEEEAQTASFPHNPATPTAFDTRHLGSSLESEPVLGEDDIMINMRFESELAWHTGNTIWSETKDSLGNIHKIAMPAIYSITTKTAFTCIEGQYVLVSAPSPRNAEGKLDTDRKIMVFVKCDVLPVIP